MFPCCQLFYKKDVPKCPDKHHMLPDCAQIWLTPFPLFPRLTGYFPQIIHGTTETLIFFSDDDDDDDDDALFLW